MSTSKNSNEPAFPKVVVTQDQLSEMDHGLTKREHFAGLAMQGLLASSGPSEDFISPIYSSEGRKTNGERVALCAIGFADALLAELAKEEIK